MNKTFYLMIAFGWIGLAGCSQSPSERGHRRILVLGDSITEGAGLASSKVYPSLLEALIREKGFPDVQVVADGVSGSTSDSGLPRLRSHLEAGEKYDILLLELGANDGLNGKDLGDLRRNLSQTIALARERGMKVLLAGMRVPPLNGLSYDAEFTDLFPDLAKRENIFLIPFLLKGVVDHPRFSRDGVHPNELGQVQVAKTVFQYLEPLL